MASAFGKERTSTLPPINIRYRGLATHSGRKAAASKLT